MATPHHSPSTTFQVNTLRTTGACPLWLGTWWTVIRAPPRNTENLPILRWKMGWPCFGGRAKDRCYSPENCPHTHSLLASVVSRGPHVGTGQSAWDPQIMSKRWQPAGPQR